VIASLVDAEIAARLGTSAQELETTAGTLSRDVLVARIQQPGSPVIAPVLSVAEVLASEQTRSRGLIIERPTGDGDTWPVLESPLRLDITPARTRTAMSRLGVIDIALLTEFPAVSKVPARMVFA
jgi:crotonobetainyl-CoA:carnitine CoA-transferase CaiB-like acyl-CoA transferase